MQRFTEFFTKHDQGAEFIIAVAKHTGYRVSHISIVLTVIDRSVYSG